jgi:putative endonuclease
MAAPTRRVLGASGETAAAAWLETRGYKVIARNVRTRYGEIDLVLRRGALVVFVEVKSRTSDRFGHPADAIVWRKRRRLVQLAEMCLQRLGLEHCAVRFDVIAVHLSTDGRVREVEHVPDAFSADP